MKLFGMPVISSMMRCLMRESRLLMNSSSKIESRKFG